MHFNLLKAFVLHDVKRGTQFIFSPAVIQYANERVKIMRLQQQEQTTAKENPSVEASSNTAVNGAVLDGDC